MNARNDPHPCAGIPGEPPCETLVKSRTAHCRVCKLRLTLMEKRLSEVPVGADLDEEYFPGAEPPRLGDMARMAKRSQALHDPACQKAGGYLLLWARTELGWCFRYRADQDQALAPADHRIVEVGRRMGRDWVECGSGKLLGRTSIR